MGVVFMRETPGTFFCSPTAYKFLVSSAPKKIHVSTQNGLQHHCRGNWGVGTCLPLGERDGKMLGSSSIEVQGFECFLSPSPSSVIGGIHHLIILQGLRIIKSQKRLHWKEPSKVI